MPHGRKTSPGRLVTCLGSERAPAALATTLTAASFALDTLSVFPLCVALCTRPGVSGCGGGFDRWWRGVERRCPLIGLFHNNRRF